jgi:hypothetical protein
VFFVSKKKKNQISKQLKSEPYFQGRSILDYESKSWGYPTATSTAIISRTMTSSTS